MLSLEPVSGSPIGLPIDFRLATSHSLMVLSVLADTSVLPSGLKATLKTALAWPVKGVLKGLRVATSQSVTFECLLPEASILPSGLKAIQKTSLVSSTDLLRLEPSISQKMIFLSAPLETNFLPSGLKATLYTAPLWPVNAPPIGPPPLTSQKVIVPSSLPHESVFPSGLKTTLNTLPTPVDIVLCVCFSTSI